MKHTKRFQRYPLQKHIKDMTGRKILAVVVLVLATNAIDLQPAAAQTDDKATRLAEATIEKMGGMQRWNDQRFLVWDIFGESHYWDKWHGDFRWERDSLTVLMNIGTKQGDAWIEGAKVTDKDHRDALLERAYARWVNNSYWLIMPYKMLDPGVNRRYVGVDTSEAGQVSDVLELTFDGVGLTPENKYHVYIDRESGMVCQWAYFENASDKEPDFVRPWEAWKAYGDVWMSTGRGSERRNVTHLALPSELPASVFTDPKRVAWRP